MIKKTFSFVEEPSLRCSKADRRAKELLTSTVRAHTGRHTHLRRRAKAEHCNRQLNTPPTEPEFATGQLVTNEAQALIEGILDCDLDTPPSGQSTRDGTSESIAQNDSPRRKGSVGGRTRLGCPHKARARHPEPSQSQQSWSTVKLAFHPLNYLAATYKGHEAARVGTLIDFYRYEFGPRYVWRVYFDEAESRSARCKFLQFFHQEPAFLEALLSVVQSHRDRGTSGVVLFSRATLLHRGKAIKLLSELLARSERAYQDAAIYAILLLLVADQSICDWKSFNVNYRGLRSIVQARGGLDVMKFYDPRMVVVVEYVDSIHQHYEEGLQTKDGYTSGLLPIRLSPPDERALEPSRLSQLPKGFIPLIKDSQMRHDFVTSLLEVINWLREHTTKDLSKPTHPARILHKPPAMDALFAALEWPDLTHAEFFTIIALHGIMALQIPVSVNSIASYIPKYVKQLQISLQHPEYRHDYMLWTGHAICGLPVTMLFVPAPIWSSLDLKVRREFFGRSWEDTRDVLASFHIDVVMEMRAEHVWGLLPGLLSF